MNDGTRKVTNPLFNASVTGGTFEEFSQNAILLPAKEKTPPPTLNITADQLLSTIVPRRVSEEIDLTTAGSTNTEQSRHQVQSQSPGVASDLEQKYNPQDNSHEATASIPTQKSSNFSSVFSSFSNILNLRSQNTVNSTQEEVVLPSVGIDSFINQPNSNAEPVPLFPAAALIPQPTPIVDQGPVNVFRRAGLKRPAYAKVPGLSNSSSGSTSQILGNLVQPQNIPPFPSQSPGNSQVPRKQTISYPPQSSVSLENIPPSSQAFLQPIESSTRSLPPNPVPFSSVQIVSSPQSTGSSQAFLQPIEDETLIQSVPSNQVPFQPVQSASFPPQYSEFLGNIPSSSQLLQPIDNPTPLQVSQPSYSSKSTAPLGSFPPSSFLQETDITDLTPVQSTSYQPVPANPAPFQSTTVFPPQSLHHPPLGNSNSTLQSIGDPISLKSTALSLASNSAPHQPTTVFTQPNVPISITPFSNPPPSASIEPLSTTFQPPPPIATASHYSQPLPIYTTSNLSHQNLPNQFKPISPPPPSLNVLSQIPKPFPTAPPLQLNQFLQPIKDQVLFPVSSSQNYGPVMDAIPASEALPSDNLGTPNPHSPKNNASDSNIPLNQVYRPVYHHWFFQKEIEGKKLWRPFSMLDSLLLEQAFNSNELDPDKVIPTDGGRYDVNILRRQRTAVYWQGIPSEVRRCSWFHKSSPDGRLVPYEENIATKLEEEFKTAFEQNQWHRKVELANGETVVLHGPDVLVVFPPPQTPDAWGNTPNQTRPRVVKRGLDEFDIDEGEPVHVDHILFMVHGIGSVCDFKFRSVEEVVDEFRNIALQLVQSHYRTSCEKGIVHRVEVLPISWHSKLHSDETGIDKQLKSITLESIPKLRDFTNDTLLDILFYTSPVYCQTITSTVGNELNRVFDLFKQRNPSFNGGVSLAGHSLGSLILFDLLCHQHPHQDKEDETEEVPEDDVFPLQQGSKPAPPQRKMSRRISYMMGSVGTGQPQIYYPHLNFEPKTFFALGSPIGMFVIVRGLDTLGDNFSLPTCPAFFNIFHPYDPIAYRIESLIRPELGQLKPVLIPHHKGRKRMHLELKETMARVGADLKQKVIDSMKSTWNSFYQIAIFHKSEEPSLEEVQKAFQQELENKRDILEEPPQEVTDIPLGSLNNGRRVDYVLQEAPLEFINEYIFALTSHVCYWESEDTILLMLKEIYSSMGFSPDNQIPQQTMTIERSPVPTVASDAVGMDPTQPIQTSSNLQPPPTTGFVRKT